MELFAGIGRFGLSAGLLCLLAACSDAAPEPYTLANWKSSERSQYAVALYAPQVGPNGKPTLSVCYSRALNSVEDIRRLVTQNCTNPGLMENKLDLYACSATAPTRATFSCDRLSREAAEARPNLGPTGSFTGAFNLY